MTTMKMDLIATSYASVLYVIEMIVFDDVIFIYFTTFNSSQLLKIKVI